MSNQSRFEVRSNKEGFQEIFPTPTAQELADFYNNSYFDSGTYKPKYSEMENILKLAGFHEAEFFLNNKIGSLLDVGCGEGFSLNYFHKKGWEVKGVDFTDNGIKRHFSHLLDKLEVGDILESLKSITAQKNKLDLVICNNVIEHVTNPLQLLNTLKMLGDSETIFRFQVPNDNSWLQRLIVDKSFANENYWTCPPAHLSYFNKSNFCPLLEKIGFKINHIMGDFPIELFLLNSYSNYKKHPETGPQSHQARVLFEHELYTKSFEDFIKFRKTCGEIGLGRNVIVYCQAIH